jgi:hypothetical protein
MLTKNRIKWVASIILGGILLVLGMAGGNWGTSFAADASVNVAPLIDHIQPSAVPAGSPYRVMIIYGENFGTSRQAIRVRLTSTGIDILLDEPLQVLPDGISQVIPADYLIEPIVYTLTVIRSNPGTVPILPPNPIYDEESNPVPFIVYEPLPMPLPIIYK